MFYPRIHGGRSNSTFAGDVGNKPLNFMDLVYLKTQIYTCVLNIVAATRFLQRYCIGCNRENTNRDSKQVFNLNKECTSAMRIT